MPGADTPSHERLRVLAAAASTAYWRGDLAAANRVYERQRDEAAAMGDTVEVADAWHSLIFTANFRGDLEAGRHAEAEARKAYQQLGDSHGLEKVELAGAFTLMPAVYADPVAVVPELESRLTRIESMGSDQAMAQAMGIRAGIALAHGDIPMAVTLGARVLRSGAEVGRESDVVMMLPAFILVAAGQARYEVAAIALGLFDAVLARHGVLVASPFADLDAEDPSADLRAAMGDDGFAAAYERGGRLSLLELVDVIETGMASPD